MAAKIRAVLDTNVVVSGLINPRGTPGRILQHLRDERFTVVTSPAINEEVLEVLNRPRLRDTYGLEEYLFDIAYLLWERTELVLDPPKVRISKDPDDDKFLAAALGGHAAYLVTGDLGDLLTLQEYRGVRIITPDTFLKTLE